MSEIFRKKIDSVKAKAVQKITVAKQDAESTVFMHPLENSLANAKQAGKEINLFEQKEKEDKKKEAKKELTPEAKYVYNYTSWGRALRLLEKNPLVSSVKSHLKKTGTQDVIDLEYVGVIEKEGNLAIKKHPEKLGEFFKKTNGAEILQLYNKNPELTAQQISGSLHVSGNWVEQEIARLVYSGIVGIKRKHNTRVFFLLEPNKLKIQPKDLRDEYIDTIIRKRKKPLGDEQAKEATDQKILDLLPSAPPLEVVKNMEGTESSDLFNDRIYALRREGKLVITYKYINGDKVLFLRKPAQKVSK